MHKFICNLLNKYKRLSYVTSITVYYLELFIGNTLKMAQHKAFLCMCIHILNCIRYCQISFYECYKLPIPSTVWVPWFIVMLLNLCQSVGSEIIFQCSFNLYFTYLDLIGKSLLVKAIVKPVPQHNLKFKGATQEHFVLIFGQSCPLSMGFPGSKAPPAKAGGSRRCGFSS